MMPFTAIEAELIQSAKEVLWNDLGRQIETGCLDDEQIFEAAMSHLCMETDAQENTPASRIDDFAHEITDHLQAFLPNNRC